MADQVKPVRRIVTHDDDQGRGLLVSDGPSPDVRYDPARPGFVATRIWVTDRTPARIEGAYETVVDTPHTIEPPAGGSVCRYITFPPDSTWQGTVGEQEVRAYFEAMGSPGASTYSPDAKHPYMQQTRTFDVCLILEGDITLILDHEEVDLHEGDTVFQHGTNHAWSNRSDKPCTIAFSLHDGAWPEQ
ncbi:MAG: cupin domain-containing protein [Chloroflexi bacterium]|nr:cupin domain-containing protein [Chloroflexota bacterium]